MFQFNFGSDSGSSMVSTTSSSSSSLDGAVDDNKPNSLYGGRGFTSTAAATDDSVFGLIPMQTLSPPPEDEEEYDEFGEPLYMLEDAASAAHNPFPAECCVQRAASSRRERYFHTMGKKSGCVGSDYRIHRPVLSAGDLMRELFPHGVPSQGVLKSGAVHISADIVFTAVGCGSSPWRGFIVDDVLFVLADGFHGNDREFRAAVMALMDLAEEVLNCFSVIVALPKNNSAPEAVSLVRAFLYSGFELVSPLLYQPSPEYLLVGFDAM
ncbi:hypothetical protein IWW39_002434 [Coemansia spiralis]|uniref:Ornithine decarboxylase antizyme n=1 Tax=Coemansia spiralis TaxID=417178 RepID=A0A9W8GN82_9FUNG|nr:hypothetical protein IWW39_002434 [Coemansia spiralis]